LLRSATPTSYCSNSAAGETPSPGQLEQRLRADVALAALDPADIVGMEAGAVGQLLLGQVARRAQAARLAAQGRQVRIVLQGGQPAWRR